MKRLSPLAIVIGLLSIQACSTFEDVDYANRANDNLATYAKSSLAEQQSSVTLTQVIAIDEVDELIAIALKNNPNLQQTLLSFKIAQQQSGISDANLWPSVSGNINANKSENSSTSYSTSLEINWTLDIWQQLSNASDASSASMLASGHAYQGAKDLLVANVINAYLGLVQSAQLIDIETARVEKLATNEQIIINRYQQGLMDLKELDTAKSNTQTSRATLVNYQAQYQQALRNLSLLTGAASHELSYRRNFPEFALPQAEITTENIGRRPDLQQAYQQIIASQFQHKVAYKSLLPSLSITGSLNGYNTSLHDALFGSSTWQLLGRLSAPIFNAGKLTSEAEIAKLTAQQRYWGFQQQLLTAINEADNAIANEKSLSEQLALTKDALANAKRSEASYINRYRQGTVTLVDLLQIQQQTFSLQAQVTQLTYQQLTNRVSLGLALGLGA